MNNKEIFSLSHQLFDENRKRLLLLVGTIDTDMPQKEYSIPLEKLFSEYTCTQALSETQKKSLTNLMVAVRHKGENHSCFFFIFDSISVNNGMFFYKPSFRFLEKQSNKHFVDFLKAILEGF